jgi:hypothetical protein
MVLINLLPFENSINLLPFENSDPYEFCAKSPTLSATVLQYLYHSYSTRSASVCMEFPFDTFIAYEAEPHAPRSIASEKARVADGANLAFFDHCSSFVLPYKL